jgi:hypothetical protein
VSQPLEDVCGLWKYENEHEQACSDEYQPIEAVEYLRPNGNGEQQQDVNGHQHKPGSCEYMTARRW